MAKYEVIGKAMVVDLAEREWYGANASPDQQRLKSVEMALASGCESVAIFVTPDPLFPSCGFDTKHRVFANALVRPKEQPFKVEHTITVTIADGVSENWEPVQRNRFVSDIRDNLNAMAFEKEFTAKYVIMSAQGKVIERGRV